MKSSVEPLSLRRRVKIGKLPVRNSARIFSATIATIDKGCENTMSAKRANAMSTNLCITVQCRSNILCGRGFLSLTAFHSECQRKGWKKHKRICGKPMSYSPSQNAGYEPAAPLQTIPPARNGYKQSLPLRNQIGHLTAHQQDAIDYVLFPKSGKIITVRFADPGIKHLFRQNREKAMTAGDRDAVTAMGQILEEKYSKIGMSREQIMRQLEKEYEFDVDAAVMKLDLRRLSQYLGREIILED